MNVRVSPASSASPAHVVASPCGSVSSTDTLRLCRAAAVANAMAVVVLPLPPLRLMTEMIMKVRRNGIGNVKNSGDALLPVALTGNEKSRGAQLNSGFEKSKRGDLLLSHTLSSAVPSPC